MTSGTSHAKNLIFLIGLDNRLLFTRGTFPLDRKYLQNWPSYENWSSSIWQYYVRSVFIIHFTDQMPLQVVLGCDDEFQIGNFTKSPSEIELNFRLKWPFPPWTSTLVLENTLYNSKALLFGYGGAGALGAQCGARFGSARQFFFSASGRFGSCHWEAVTKGGPRFGNAI